VTRVFVTGLAGGLGRAATVNLLGQGHKVVIHARSRSRLTEPGDLVDGDTVELAEYLAGNVSGLPVLLVLTLRDSPASAARRRPGTGGSRRAITYLPLDRLTRGQYGRPRADGGGDDHSGSTPGGTADAPAA